MIRSERKHSHSNQQLNKRDDEDRARHRTRKPRRDQTNQYWLVRTAEFSKDQYSDAVV